MDVEVSVCAFLGQSTSKSTILFWLFVRPRKRERERLMCISSFPLSTVLLFLLCPHIDDHRYISRKNGARAIFPSLPFSASSSSSSTLMAISNITSWVRASAKCHFYIDLCPNRLAIGRRGENGRASFPGESHEIKRPKKPPLHGN